MSTRFDPCAYEEKMLMDLASMQRVRLQEYGGPWYEAPSAWLFSQLQEKVEQLKPLARTTDIYDIEVKCADIANYAAMVSANARRSS